MPEIRVTADVSNALKGFKALEAELDKLRQKASQASNELQGFRLPEGGLKAGGMVNRNSSGNIQPVAAPRGSGLAHAPSSMSQRHRATFGRGGQQYNLNTPTGVEEYIENVLSQVGPMLGGARTGSIASRFGVKYQGYQTHTNKTKPTNDQMYTWFTKLGSDITKMDQQTRNAYLQAITESTNSSSAYPKPVRDFVNTYGAQLGAPRATTTASVIAQSARSRFAQHFTNNANGRSIGGALGAGLKGAIGGSLIDMAAGGEAGALGAGMIGGTLGGPVGAIAAVGIQSLFGAAADTIGQGIQTFKQTIPAFSALSHALDGATNHVNQFRYATQLAGARTAMTPEQSTQAAMTLAQAFGMSGGTKGITNLVSQAGRFGLMNGISPTTMASMMSTVGALGITNGAGASMNSLSFNKMLLNMTQLSHMQGRQQGLYTGLLGVYSGLGNVNPIISSANSTAAIYTAMNGTGIQGLQGQRGANILTQMNSTLGSGHGLAGIMGMAAIYQASGGKVSNPWQMMSIAEQGLGAHVGSTTYGAQLQKMVQQMAPGNLYTQAGILSSVAGISVNQAMAMLKSGAMGAQHISTINNSTQKMTPSDRTTSASARLKVKTSGVGYALNQLKALGAKAIGTPTTVGTNGMSGSIYANNPTSNSSYAGPRYSSRGVSGGGVSQWLPQMLAASKATGVPVSVIRAIMLNEDPSGAANAGSLKHAYGLMQLEPVGHGGPAGATNAARSNPASNILVGAQYLKRLYNQFGKNWGLAASAYFAGAGAIQAHVKPSQYQESLSQLSNQLNFTPAGNSISVENYAANFEQNAVGGTGAILPQLESQHMMTERGISSPGGSNVISLSPQTMSQLATMFASELTKKLMQYGGKGPSN